MPFSPCTSKRLSLCFSFFHKAPLSSKELFSHVYASHQAKNIKDWQIYGRYHHKLKKTPKGWKITFMKLIVHGQQGNLDFLKEVSK